MNFVSGILIYYKNIY